MRTIAIVTTALVVALAGARLLTTTHAQKQKPEGSAQVTLKVPDMFCGGCELAVKMAANKVAGVNDVKTSLEKRTAEVAYDPSKTNADAIAGAITRNSGFKVEVSKAAKK